jgi:hypothetical protein
VTLYAVCTMHKETRTAGFLVEPQNQGRLFFSGLASKPLERFVSGLTSKLSGRFLPVWPQNRWWRVSRFGPQNRQLRFGGFGLKITATVSWFGPQNQAGYGLSVVPQNRWEYEDGAGHTSRSSGLLWLEASQAKVFQSDLKTGRGAAWVVHVTSSRRLRRSEAKDDRFDGIECGAVQVKPNYPYFVVIFFLPHRGILVFWFML